MKTIGLLGGMSWESSIQYERLINEGVRSRLGGTASADLMIRSYDSRPSRPSRKRGTGPPLAGCWPPTPSTSRRREPRPSCSAPTPCTWSPPSSRPPSTCRFSTSLMSPPPPFSKRASHRWACSGTRYTMEQDFYRGRLERQGLDVLVPDEPDRTPEDVATR